MTDICKGVTFRFASLNCASLLQGLPTHPELAWMGPVRASPAAGLSGYKSKAPHTASIRDAVGLGLEHHFSQCCMPAQGRLLGLVGETGGSNVPTPTPHA